MWIWGLMAILFIGTLVVMVAGIVVEHSGIKTKCVAMCSPKLKFTIGSCAALTAMPFFLFWHSLPVVPQFSAGLYGIHMPYPLSLGLAIIVAALSAATWLVSGEEKKA